MALDKAIDDIDGIQLAWLVIVTSMVGQPGYLDMIAGYIASTVRLNHFIMLVR